VASGGGARRLDPIRGSGPQFGTRRAPTRCARSDEASRAVAAAERRRDGRSTRRRGSVESAKSGEVSRAAQGSGSRTNDANVLLTSKRDSWVAPCRRGGSGGRKQRAHEQAKVAARVRAARGRRQL
jgi:hypothetical protein